MRATRRRRLRVVLIGLLLVLGVGGAIVITTLQRAMLFPRYAVRAWPDAGRGVEGLERTWIDVGEGERVESWFLPGRGASAEAPGPVVVFAHGNGEVIEQWPDPLERYRELGVSVFLPEYRGYGRSGGSPSEDAITDDFVRFYDQLTERPDVDPDRIVFHGRSLGGGAVCGLARHRSPRALILMSTFTSVSDVARRWWVPKALIRDRFENLDFVRTYERPTLVVHGRQDTLISVAHARELAAAAPDAKLVLYDASHNDCPPDWEVFWVEVEAFLRHAGVI